MTLKMEIECGTLMPKKFEIDLDEYSKVHAVDVSPEYRKKAYDLLHATLNEVTFADDGHRNNDAVNSLIALHVLGYNAGEWMENFLIDMEGRPNLFYSIDISEFENHIMRVLPYLEKWGPEGNEARALQFALWN